MYNAAISDDILETTSVLLNVIRAAPQINEIISKHLPFGEEMLEYTCICYGRSICNLEPW